MSNRTDMLAAAIEAGLNHWQIGPLCDIDPETKRIVSPQGKVPVGHLVPHGVLDFTTDIDVISRWWSRRPWNIGARVPETMFVLDVDDLGALAQLEAEYGRLPETFTTISGREAGGKHLYFRRPAGKISHRRLPKGVEIKTSSGYVVQPPSIHPDSGRRYTRVEAPVAAPPNWLIDLLLPEPPKITPRRSGRQFTLHSGPSIADEYAVKASWATILEIHGWECLDVDPDADGARWRHPRATSKVSATIRNGCLFVYSPNTQFDVTEPGNACGYTKFRAYAVLDHNGDMSAAARALRGQVVAR
jgi:hypothetical protein